MSEWLAVKAHAEQRAQLNKYCGDPTFLERVEAFAQILNQVILLDVIWGEKSKPITGMRRNELVDGEDGEGGGGAGGVGARVSG